MPITGNVRYTANYADRDVKKISLAERPADSYIEGSKFDPTGLKLTVTYDDDREKVVEYSADDSNFEFLPALDQELTTADTKVSVSYRGSSAVDIPITVAEKKITAAPVISPNGGTFTGSQKVSITCPTAGAVIYYTTDGTTPTAASTKYAGEFTITATTTVKAIAVSEGMNDSTVTSAAFTKRPLEAAVEAPDRPSLLRLIPRLILIRLSTENHRAGQISVFISRIFLPEVHRLLI